jgi:hypothetical protein
MKFTVFGSMLLVAGTSIAPSLAFAASDPSPEPGFSPQAVFALPAHKTIDDACPAARKFADAASVSTDSITAQQAVDGANTFLACYRVRRLNPDPQAQRYLALAAGAALYLAASETTGNTAVQLFKAADSIGEQLGAPTPDHSIVIDKVEVGTRYDKKNTESVDQAMTNAQDQSLVGHGGPPHTTYVIRRDPFGKSYDLDFTGYATAMRVDIDKHLTAIAADEKARRQGSAASPAPAPTKSP